MTVFDRKSGKPITEDEPLSGALNFLYGTAMGRALLKIAVSPCFSELAAVYRNSPLSRKDIAPFCEKHGITLENGAKYRNFNEFFTRKKAVSVSLKPLEVPAISDSRLSVFPIDENLRLRIKRSEYSVSEILKSRSLAEKYAGGMCFVFRLSLTDCHRYLFPDDGVLMKHWKIRGVLHTVRAISEEYRVFSRNSREVSVLKTRHFGTVTQIEVGAMLTGKIRNHELTSFKKGQEKGFFEYGGSTVILLFPRLKNGYIQPDYDILKNSRNDIETLVEAGERIAEFRVFETTQRGDLNDSRA
ncbi:MAG: phosphatidylserine decarboxylase [Oscillospiraceae bacterium]